MAPLPLDSGPSRKTDEADPATRSLESTKPSPEDSQTTRVTAGEGIDDDTISRLTEGISKKSSQELPATFAHFQIRRFLGEGAFGAVYEGYDPQLERSVAIKVAKLDRGDAEHLVKRFLREAKSAARLRHPHIVPVYECGRVGDQFFIASEFIPGTTLQADQKARNGGKPDFDRAARIIQQMADALAYAHTQGIIHRDLKPANTMLDSNDHPMVMDFGLATRADEVEKLTHAGQVLGTPRYMSPEQARGDSGAAIAASDQYSLGVMLYELIAGRPPFEGSVEFVITQHLDHEPPSPRSFQRSIPRDLETICLKCLEKRPEDRYPDCRALAEDLRRFREGEPVKARRLGFARRTVRLMRKHPLATSLSAAIFALIAVSAILFSQYGSERQSAKQARDLAGLAQDFERELDGDPARPEAYPTLDRLVEQIAELDPAQGDAARQKLDQRTTSRFAESLKRPRITAEDVPALEAELTRIQTRDPAKATELRQSMTARLRNWQTVAHLTKPIGAPSEVFETGVQISQNQGLSSREPDARVATRIASSGPGRMEVEFETGWAVSSRVGVAFDVPKSESSRETGYQFLLVPDPVGDPDYDPMAKQEPGKLSFHKTKGAAILRIVRNGQILRERRETFDTSRPVMLKAERDGNQLALQVNQLPRMECLDLTPVNRPGEFLVVWPGNAVLSMLRIESLPLPPAASSIEKADALLAAGKPGEALPIFERAAVTSSGHAAQEAKVKAGLCLIQLNRTSEAVKYLEPVSAEDGSIWPAVASVHIWLTLLETKKFDEAEAMMRTIVGRFPKEQIARFVSKKLRDDLLGRTRLPLESIVMPDPAGLHRTEAVLATVELLGDTYQIFHRKYLLALNHALLGDDRKAYNLMAPAMAEVAGDPAIGRRSEFEIPWQGRLFGWMAQRVNKAEDACKVLERILAIKDPAYEQFILQSLRVPLARLHASQQRWIEAETQVDRYLALHDESIRNIGTLPNRLRSSAIARDFYPMVAEAWLVKAALRDRAGDEAGAAAAWKRGTYNEYLSRFPESVRKEVAGVPSGGYGLISNLLAAGRANTLTDEEASANWNATLALLNSDPLFQQMAKLFPFPPKIIRNIWQSERAKRIALQVTLLDLTPLEYVMATPKLFIYEMFREELLAGKPTEIQDDLIWKSIEEISNQFHKRKIGKTQIMQLVLTWNGTFGSLGWGGAAPKLPPSIRGSAAYLLGFRYLQLNRTADAKTLFTTARNDAPAGSELRKLAEAELAKDVFRKP